MRAEAFSFALAVVLTPAVIVKEGYRFLTIPMASGTGASVQHLRWLSSCLVHENWYPFGIYCVLASMAVFFIG